MNTYFPLPITLAQTIAPSHVIVDNWETIFGIAVLGILIGLVVGMFIVKAGKGGLGEWLNKLAADFTNLLAYMVILLAFIGIFFLSLKVIVAEPAKLESAKYVFGAVLPLLGTWVGTVLAHYFQKENLAAATQSITDLASKVGGSSSPASKQAGAVMTKWDDIKSIPPDFATPDDYNSIDLKTLATKLRALNQQRLPLFNADKSPKVVIHLSSIDDFLAKQPAPAPQHPGAIPQPGPTLQSFLDDADIKTKLAGSFDVFSITSTLQDLQKGMSRQCEDIFLTQNGKPGEPVLGWVTNDKLAESLKS